MKMKEKAGLLAIFGIVALLMGGCATATDNATGAQTGTASGVALGALLGGMAGNNISGLNTAEGAVAGALVGGLLGHHMGSQNDRMDNQQREINSVRQEASQQVVNIDNPNGSITPVVLHRVGNQWQGPRGELYNSLPTPRQLAPIYGLN